jgi:hypothetical protein
MTKPIEGWVAWHLGKLPNCTLGDFIQVFPEQPPESGLQFRPVKITFTDEVRNDQCDEKIETAINNFKERTWALISSSQNYADKTVNLQNVEEAIFGWNK